jgi:signal transduction histidine kinase
MIDLNHWLQGLLPTWREAALEKRLHWEQKVPANLPQIYADSHRLAQVLGNLISNAVKFTPVGGSISVTAGSENGEAWVSVNDTGPGIAPEEQELIFNRFYRGGKGRRFPQGMGLGLSIAKELAEAHGGHLEVTSAPGAGSKFTLWIPATERDAVRERQPGG